MTKISIMGKYSTGKRTIASAFTGIERDKLVSRQSRWISQMKGSKDGIDLQGLPEEHGRMSAYRQRLAAIAESKAFIIVLRNSEPVHFEYYHELVTGTLADKSIEMGPWMVIAGYITDTVPDVNPIIEQWAKSINATVELVNVAKLSAKDAAETKKLDTLIRSFAGSIESAPKSVPKKKQEEEEEPVPVVTKPVVKAKPASPPAKKTTTLVPNKVEPKPSKVSRALSFLVRGGSVA